MSNLPCTLTPKIFLSPFVLSTVMLDNSNCPGDQEGFLLGRSYKSVRFEINDQSMCNAEEDLMISVFSAYPCGKFLSFYDSNGVINIEFIRNFLGDRLKHVIGWYRFRRNVPPYPSAREAIVHCNLMRIFSGNVTIGDGFFVYGIFGSSMSENASTHTYDYAFYIERPDRFVPLAMSMLNLIDTKTKYRSGSLASSFVNSQTFDSVLNIAWSFESCWQTEDGIQQMHKLLRDKCSNLAEELTASESVNATIEEDVRRLESELESLTVNETSSEESDSDDGNFENDNIENISPCSSPESITVSRKRYFTEVTDLEGEKSHPVYGRYFEQNRVEDQQGLSLPSTSASDNNSYALPPPKKFKILQEHKKMIDHDYNSASDDDSHKYIQYIESEKPDDLDRVNLPSETENCDINDGTPVQEIIVSDPNILSKVQDHTHETQLVYETVETVEEVIVESVADQNVSDCPSTAETTTFSNVNEADMMIGVEVEIEVENEIENEVENNNASTSGTGSNSVETSTRGRPYIVYCKAVVKEDDSSISDK